MLMCIIQLQKGDTICSCFSTFRASQTLPTQTWSHLGGWGEASEMQILILHLDLGKGPASASLTGSQDMGILQLMGHHILSSKGLGNSLFKELL